LIKLFSIYLDALFKKNGFTKFRLHAYADDLLLCLDTIEDLKLVIETLEKLSPYLVVNKTKSAIISTKRNLFSIPDEFLGVPIVNSYMYLGCMISCSTRKVIDSALSLIKRKVGHIKLLSKLET
jgi:hypothetical protein